MKNKLLAFILGLVISANTIGSVTLILPDLHGQSSSQITVPVKVKTFQDIISIQGTIHFDPAIVTYASVQNFGLPGMTGTNFGITGVSSGNLTFSWFDGTLAGVSLTDSATIFSITFNIIGTNTQISTLSFVNTPTLIEVIDNAYNPVTTILDNGSITVQNGPAISDVTLYLDSVAGTVGSTINVSMRAYDFVNINSIQGTIQFDPAVATFSSISYFGLPGMNASNFGVTQVNSGKLTFTWYDSSLEGINFADAAALFTISFNLTCNAANTTLNITDTPTLIEVTDSLFNTLNTIIIPGKIVNNSFEVVATASPDSICPGASSTLIANGASTYFWSPNSGLSATTGTSVTATPLATITYSIIGTNATGCTSTSSVMVTVMSTPIAGFTYIDNGNGSVTFTNTSQNATSYSWDFGDGSTDNAFNPAHTYTMSGNYIVTLIASNTCNNTIFYDTINVIISNLSTSLFKPDIEVFPNPGNGLLNIKYHSVSGNLISIKVTNIAGEMVFKREFVKTMSSGLIQLDFCKFTNGIYHIEVNDENEILRTNFIINK